MAIHYADLAVILGGLWVLEMGCAISRTHKLSNSLPGLTHLCLKSEKTAIPLTHWVRNSPKSRDGFRRNRIPEYMHGIGCSDFFVMDSFLWAGALMFEKTAVVLVFFAHFNEASKNLKKPAQQK
jgi:hypothetical protein